MAQTAKLSIALVFMALAVGMLAGCNDDGSTASAAGTSGGLDVTKTALRISGVPAPLASIGTTYSFLPTVTDATGATLTFSITNKPSWASFNTATGALSGTPSVANIGAAPIQISVSDETSSATLKPFTISVIAAPIGLAISGNAPTSIMAGSTYNFYPTVNGAAAGATLSFSVSNPPAWATFNPKNGLLSGTPTSSNLGVSANVGISVSDGVHSAALKPFSIAVTADSADAVTVYWTAPALNSNGSAVTDLAGYRIYYGRSATSLTTVITVEGASDTSQLLNLAAGTWYIAITAFNSAKIESQLSAVLPLTI
jgi:Putative Ig domain